MNRIPTVAIALLLAGLVVFAAGPSNATTRQQAASTSGHDEMTAAKAALLGVVEGVTEYIPVSSTGHLTVTQRLVGIGRTPATKDAADSYAIAIQAGAILAVLVLYRRRAAALVGGLAGRSPTDRRIALALVAAFVPAAMVGVAFEPVIKDRLFGIGPIVAAWLVGGIAILVFERARHRRPSPTLRIEDMTVRMGLLIGIAQCASLWPGVSRSLVTLVAGLALGLSMAAAVEFSFLLGLITLGAATAYETVGHAGDMTAAYGYLDPIIGLVVAFIAALAAIRWMVGYLNRHGLALFGWYRIALAVVVGALMVTGTV